MHVHIQENDIQVFFQMFFISHPVFSILHVIKVHTEHLYGEKENLNCLLRTLPSLPLDEVLGHGSVKWNYGCSLSASIWITFQLCSFLASCSNLSHQNIFLAQFSVHTISENRVTKSHVFESGQTEHH